MRLLACTFALLTAVFSGGAHAAKVYRCPDGTYADKPCGEGARVVTTTRRSSGGTDTQRACAAVGEDAERISRKKTGGVSATQALAAVDNEYLGVQEKSARRRFVTSVYQTPGSPGEVRAIVEADCLAKADAAEKEREKERAAKAAAEAAAAKAAAQPAPAAAEPAKTAGLSKEQCDKLKKDLAAVRKQQAALAELDDAAPASGAGSMDASLGGLCN
ncbi:MAG: hypothetical protein JNL33_08050 [Betaproteobacteria bacterium]|nr:hypothetical protein [Betaproteobacteria bacterium]MBL8533791.1 hypothetical protein [Betaproteobacteria bacterium]